MEMEEPTLLAIQKELILKLAWLRFSSFLFPSEDGGVSFSFGRWRMPRISVSIIHYTRIINIPYPALDFMFQKQANSYTKLFFCRSMYNVNHSNADSMIISFKLENKNVGTIYSVFSCIMDFFSTCYSFIHMLLV
jgi:hypothetical protein